ncbi:MAG: signal recognition particle-docking protein FtsY, partial [Gammaproteobacteria bacterium]
MKGATPKAARGMDAPPSFLGRLRQRLNRGASWLSYDLTDLFTGR